MPDVEPPRKVLAYLQALNDALPATMLELGLLRGAWRSGTIAAAVEPRTAAALAKQTGTEPDRARSLAEALVAFEVFDRTDDRYVLTARWRALLLDGAPMPLDAALDHALATGRMLEAAAGGGPDYWTGDDADRLAFAIGVAPDPEARTTRELAEFLTRLNPTLRATLESGGRYLELGCGTAGAMSSNLQLFPDVSAVGVELDPALVEVARGRAERLGLTDRMRIVCADAQDFSDPDPFDFAFWSQFFFPEATRAGALAVAHRSLRPGGSLSAPLLGEPVTDVAGLRTPEGQAAAVDAVLHGAWGVPHRSAGELQEELVAAGFVDPHLDELGFARIVRVTRP